MGYTMELLQLKYFKDAALTENFSHTAKNFYVPQSAVSQSIKRLETELGVELFNRNSNKLQLSESGKLFYSYIEKSLSALEEGIASVKKYSTDTKGTISILINNNRRFITDCIAKFKSIYPYIDFNIYHNISEFEKTHFDFIISNELPDTNGYQKIPIIVENILLSIPKNHILSKRKSLDFKEIRNEPFISMSHNSSLYNILYEIFKAGGAYPNVTIYCDDPYYVRKYTAIGLGISLFPEFSWMGLLENNVVNIPFKDMSPKRTTYLYYSNHSNSDLKYLFREFVISLSKQANNRY